MRRRTASGCWTASRPGSQDQWRKHGLWLFRGPDTYVNIMDQYHPAWRAREHPPLDRCITAAEYREAVGMAEEAGLRRIAN